MLYATYGLMATPVALLMIGGEFDLSAWRRGDRAVDNPLFSYEFTTNAWVGVLVALGWRCSSSQRLDRGQDRIPSFLVTLGRSSCSRA